jgi:hypothetical protein
VCKKSVVIEGRKKYRFTFFGRNKAPALSKNYRFERGPNFVISYPNIKYPGGQVKTRLFFREAYFLGCCNKTEIKDRNER